MSSSFSARYRGIELYIWILRSWSDVSTLPHIRSSRKRILLIFLLIRYTGARLNEVLTLDLSKQFDISKRVIRYDNLKSTKDLGQPEVQISSELVAEMQAILNEPAFAKEVCPC